MRMLSRSGSVLVMILGCAMGMCAQDPPASPPPSVPPVNATPSVAPSSVAPSDNAQAMPPAAVTLNEVIDRVVQREHLFMAQMRHMHPLVETYLQDLKNDQSGHATPIHDRYFLGRLDLSDGPEDISF